MGQSRAQYFSQITGRPMESHLTLADLHAIEVAGDPPPEPEKTPEQIAKEQKIAELRAQLAEAEK